MALKYLKNSEVNFWNLLTMTGDFNISFNIYLSEPINQVSTRYSNNNQESSLVLDLMFLWFGSEKLNNYSIQLECHLISDHAPLTIIIPIIKVHIQTKKQTIVKDRMKRKISLRNLSNLSVQLIPVIYQMLIYLKMLSLLSLIS